MPANNSYKCYPNVAIAADPTLESYTAPGAAVTYGGQTLPADQGPCIYYFGNTGGALYYQSPNGTFTTPALGKVDDRQRRRAAAGQEGAAASRSPTASAYKASGTVELTAGGKLAATAKFSLQPKAKGSFKITFTRQGQAALRGQEDGQGRADLGRRERRLGLQLGSAVHRQVGQALTSSIRHDLLKRGAASRPRPSALWPTGRVGHGRPAGSARCRPSRRSRAARSDGATGRRPLSRTGR